MTAAPASVAASSFVVVEQLNHAQWYASCPVGTWRASGVQNYAGAVADALWMAVGSGLGVQTIGLDGSRLILQHPEAQ